MLCNDKAYMYATPNNIELYSTYKGALQLHL